MPNRIAVTAALALAATIGTGTVALASTLTGPPGTVGTDAAVSLARPAPPTTTAAPGSTPAFDPQAVALLAFAARMNSAGTPGTASTPVSVGAPAAPGSAVPAPDEPRAAGAPAGDTDHPAPASGPAPAAAPTTTTTGAPAFDCRGSDDGLSNAVQRARETYCHGGSDD